MFGRAFRTLQQLLTLDTVYARIAAARKSKNLQRRTIVKRSKPIVFVSSFAILTMLVIASNAPASVVDNNNVPVSGAVINSCNGETVTFNGIDHFVATVTLDSSGGFHLFEKDNVHVTATGSLDNSYEGNEEQRMQLNGRVGMVQTNVMTVTVIGLGSAPNFVVHALEHITVNANGTVTAAISTFTSSCPV
jgi:hypothetical protein